MPHDRPSPSPSAARDAFDQQSEVCRKMQAPFTALLCESLLDALPPASPLAERILGWEGDPGPNGDALPLRLTGALHALVRRGSAPALARHYPPAALPGAEVLKRDLAATLADHENMLASWLERPPQTNDVGRSAALMSGLLAIVRQFGKPIELLELGSSAGLNLLLDRYAYDLGGTIAGDPRSPLCLRPRWKGNSPPDARVEILSRRGVDLTPIDIMQPQDRERLFAYVWPDHVDRLAQLNAALEACAGDRPPVDEGNAADWLERQLESRRGDGRLLVIMHSYALQYFTSQVRQRVEDALVAAGKAVSRHRPLAWLRLEHDRRRGRAMLRLVSWPGGDSRDLAICHPHGRSISWLV